MAFASESSFGNIPNTSESIPCEAFSVQCSSSPSRSQQLVQFDKLPNELLYHLTGYLSIGDVKKLRLVNYRWSKICTTRIQRSNLTISFDNLRRLRQFSDTFSTESPILSNRFHFLSEILNSRPDPNRCSHFDQFGLKCGEIISACHLEMKDVVGWLTEDLSRNMRSILSHATNLTELTVTSNTDIDVMILPVLPKLQTLSLKCDVPSSYNKCLFNVLSTKVPAISTITLNVFADKLPNIFKSLATYGHTITCRLNVKVISKNDTRAILDIATTNFPSLKVTEIILCLRRAHRLSRHHGIHAALFCLCVSFWLAQQSDSLRKLSIFDDLDIIDNVAFPSLPFLEQMSLGETPHQFPQVPSTHFPKLRTLLLHLQSLLSLFGGGGNLPTVTKLWLRGSSDSVGISNANHLLPNVKSLKMDSCISMIPMAFGFQHLASIDLTLHDSSAGGSELNEWCAFTNTHELMSDKDILAIPFVADEDENSGLATCGLISIWNKLTYLKITRYRMATVRALVYLRRTGKLPKLKELVMHRGAFRAPIPSLLVEDLRSHHYSVELLNP